MSYVEKLGIVPNRVYEAIISTYSSEGTPNAAPMGIMFHRKGDEYYLEIEPFIATQTYKNLESQKGATVNFSNNPLLFYQTALKEYSTSFERGRVVNAPRLLEADAFLEVSVVNLFEQSDRAKVVCHIEAWTIHTLPYRPYCRGKFAALESIIHATRIKAFMENAPDRVQALMDFIQYYRTLIEKVSPDSEYSEIMDAILIRIDEWKRTEI